MHVKASKIIRELNNFFLLLKFFAILLGKKKRFHVLRQCMKHAYWNVIRYCSLFLQNMNNGIIYINGVPPGFNGTLMSREILSRAFCGIFLWNSID